MANPLRLFRKYQYALLVAFGIMLMFAFVVAPPLSDYLHSRAGARGGGNPVVVSWRGTALHEAQLDQLRARHILTIQFLESLVQRVILTDEVTVSRRGEQVTLVKGRTYPLVGRGMNERNEMVAQIAVAGELVEVPQSVTQPIQRRAELIAPAQNEEELVQRLILADQARALGVVIDEDAILDYLNNLCDAPPTQPMNFAALLREATGGRLDWRAFQAQLATDLAAQRMLIMAHGGLAATPPEVMYDCYNQLKRQVTAELLAVDVSSFLDEVPAPSEADLTAVYEAGKNRFPSPLSPEPGFKRQQRIAFGYFQAVFEEFLSREAERLAADITDAEIDQYYEENKATEFRIPELPPATDEPAVPAAEPPAEPPAAPAAAPAESGAPEGGKPAAEPAAEPAEPATPEETQPAAAPAESGASEGGEPAAEPAAEPAEPAEPATPEETQPAADPAESGAPEGGEPAEETSALRLTLVSYRAQDEGTDEAAEVPPAPAEAAADAPAPQDEAAAGAAEATTTLAAPAAADQSESAAAQYRPLDETLRGEIRMQLARRAARTPAQEQMEKAAEAARGVVEQYGRQLARARALENAADPDPVDWEAVAREHLLHYGKTPLLDVLDLAMIREADPADDDPPYYALARATETMFGQQTGMIHRTLIDVGFGRDLAPFVTQRLVDGMLPQGGFPIAPDQLFTYWREEVEPEEVPPLDAVREEVVRAWKLQQALPRARDKAEQLARQAADSGQPLATVFADQTEQVIHTDPFSWFTRGSIPFGMQAQLGLSQVRGQAGERRVTVAGTGDDFMHAVFDLQVGQVGVAVNQPQTFVYVVRVDSEMPADQQRREAFFAAGLTTEVVELARFQMSDIVRDWYTSLEREYQVKWNRPPSTTRSFD